MFNSEKSGFNIKNASDLAYAIVVLTSYFIAFTEIDGISSGSIIVMISLGVSYITIGIYGYSFIQNKDNYHLQITYYFVQMISAGLIIYLAKVSGLIALIFFPLIGQSVTIKYKRLFLLVNIFICLIYIFSLGFGIQSNDVLLNEVPAFIIGQILIITFMKMVIDEQNARKELELAANDLSSANRRLKEYAQQIEELATSKERNRLAREIHDGLGHYLTTIFMQIEATNLLIKNNPQKASLFLMKAERLTKVALDDVRRSVETLKGKKEDFLSLPEKINYLFENLISETIESDFLIIGTPRKLSIQCELTLYRAVQEMINNTIKHSRATKINSYLKYNPEEKKVTLYYKDNGIGSDNPSGGFGLISMKERVKLLNGDLRISSNIDQGFCVNIEIPE